MKDVVDSSNLSSARKEQIDALFSSYLGDIVVIAASACATSAVWTELYKDRQPDQRGVKEKSGIIYADHDLQAKAEVAIRSRSSDVLDSLRDNGLDDLLDQIQNYMSPRIHSKPATPPRTEFLTTRNGSPFHFGASDADSAFQVKDMAVVVDIMRENHRGRQYRASLVERQAYRMVKAIHDKWPGELADLRLKGPALDGTAGYFYHSDIFSLVSRYMEEMALAPTLYPPHGKANPEEVRNIVKYWNGLKKYYAGLLLEHERLGSYLKLMKFPGKDIVYHAPQIEQEEELER